MQYDPYDQFASGYVGMGNDPVNNFDLSGGYSFGPMHTRLLNHVFWTVGGAVIGGILDGGNGKNGALIGGGIGLGVSFVN